MLRILTATALTATLAMPAMADNHASSDDSAMMNDDTAMMEMDNLIRTRDITGGPIYSIALNYDETMWTDAEPATYSTEIGTETNRIGEIEDIVLNESGQMIGIVAEVGGFLDIGDKHVMIPVEDLQLTAVDDRTYSYVTRLSEEQLEEMPAVDESWMN
ncbi:PRC-barrel domain-containing protein [Jannaschia aquimarina]|uniref:PRC-barrel domain protein n=1 Tax=Jannaschia aquimarina TaxID=935700 RepID=A0A0D1EJW2_9RHOB|nr:PRC-barrel domain-containing protein [Jannaschia aquimarina]KIT16100.1 PRC-barrel domain protein [Jannaschia aquimarina]SNT02373.1 PRC-barrel domain-containing protein [Jannaschia aquimarina]